MHFAQNYLGPYGNDESNLRIVKNLFDYQVNGVIIRVSGEGKGENFSNLA